MAGRPRIYQTVEEIEEAIDAYFFHDTFTEVQTNSGVIRSATGKKVPNEKPTISGLSLHLGFADKTTLYDYRDRPEFSHSIKRALTRIEMFHEERLSEGNVTGSIFALKNMGWKDKQEVENSGSLSINWNEQRSYETK